MSLSTPTRVSVPFAVSGLKATIPASSNNTTGRAGYDQGFPAINMTAKTAGGIPPFGQDFNGILYDVTLALRYMEAGSGFVYDSTFSTAIGGYKSGAMIPRTDGAGFWLATTDAVTTDPEAAGADAAGWRPVATAGTAAVTMTNANVTLTPLQWGKPIIVITGTLTANLNLIFPAMPGQWTVLNSTTGAFTITCKTAAGTGVIAVSGSSSIFGDGTNIYQSATVIASPTLINIVRYATAGSGTYNKPSNVSKLRIRLIGGGGGGATGSGDSGSGGGGGSGGFSEKLITSPSASYAYTVGAAGSTGGAGGNTTIAGMTGNGGAAGSSSGGNGGAGGSASGGDLNVPGSGGNGAANTRQDAGAGGSGFWGGAGYGAGSNGTSGAAGGAGSFGGGGGGGAVFSGGGAGGAGYIEIEEYA